MDIKYCAICGKEIIGEYEYIKTKRGNEMYIHKKCAKGDKEHGDNYRRIK